jgi:cytochrome c oxidase subunit 3
MKPESDSLGARIGMWLFLYTEIMLFGGLFVLYAAYFSRYTADFVQTGRELDLGFGAGNTLILLVSSFAVAAAITAVRRGKPGTSVRFLLLALVLGGVFLFDKYLEWGHKIDLGIYPGSPDLEGSPDGRVLFFSLYYVITGLHGVHIVIGMTLLALSAVMVQKGRITTHRYVLLENSALYWHLVDLIWIFIFPLFYLIL